MKSFLIKEAQDYWDDNLRVFMGVQCGWTEQGFDTNI